MLDSLLSTKYVTKNYSILMYISDSDSNDGGGDEHEHIKKYLQGDSEAQEPNSFVPDDPISDNIRLKKGSRNRCQNMF